MDQYNSLYKKYAKELENYTDDTPLFQFKLDPEQIEIQYIILGVIAICAFVYLYLYG